jgi:hypothetical protein
VERVALFHFTTRSREDFDRKSVRGGGANPVGKPIEFFNQYQRCVTCIP